MYKKNTADLKSMKAFRTYHGLKERRTEKKTHLPMLPMIKKKNNKTPKLLHIFPSQPYLKDKVPVYNKKENF